MSLDWPTVEELVNEAICLVCDRNGRDPSGKYRFTRDQLVSTRMVEVIESAATGSDAQDSVRTISHVLSEMSKSDSGILLRRVGHGLYELGPTLVWMLAKYRTNEVLKRRLPGWDQRP